MEKGKEVMWWAKTAIRHIVVLQHSEKAVVWPQTMLTIIKDMHESGYSHM